MRSFGRRGGAGEAMDRLYFYERDDHSDAEGDCAGSDTTSCSEECDGDLGPLVCLYSQLAFIALFLSRTFH